MARAQQVQGDNRVPEQKALVVSNFDRIKGMLLHEKVQEQIQSVAPLSLAKMLTPSRVARFALMAIQKSEKLQRCTPESIVQSVVTLTTLGLECSGVSGEAYLVPFKVKEVMECTPITGYRGLIVLAKRSGHVKSISAQLVYANDEFRMNIADDSPVVHIPTWGEAGELLGGYAVAYLSDGGIVKERMTVGEINAVRDRSPSYRAYKAGIWVDDYGQMARKTLVRRISHYVPLSPEMSEAFALEDAREDQVSNEMRRSAIDASSFGFQTGDSHVAGQAEDQSNAPSAVDQGGATGEVGEAGRRADPERDGRD